MEGLPRELVWDVVGRLPVRDVLLGVGPFGDRRGPTSMYADHPEACSSDHLKPDRG